LITGGAKDWADSMKYIIIFETARRDKHCSKPKKQHLSLEFSRHMIRFSAYATGWSLCE